MDLLGTPANGMLLNNNATMEDSTGWKSVADAQIVYQEDGGNARSNIFKVELTKNQTLVKNYKVRIRIIL